MKTENAVVYRGGGRRWFTKRAAARADAREKIRTKCECEKGDHITPDEVCNYHYDLVRFNKMVRRLARMYERSCA